MTTFLVGTCRPLCLTQFHTYRAPTMHHSYAATNSRAAEELASRQVDTIAGVCNEFFCSAEITRQVCGPPGQQHAVIT